VIQIFPSLIILNFTFQPIHQPGCRSASPGQFAAIGPQPEHECGRLGVGAAQAGAGEGVGAAGKEGGNGNDQLIRSKMIFFMLN